MGNQQNYTADVQRVFDFLKQQDKLGHLTVAGNTLTLPAMPGEAELTKNIVSSLSNGPSSTVPSADGRSIKLIYGANGCTATEGLEELRANLRQGPHVYLNSDLAAAPRQLPALASAQEPTVPSLPRQAGHARSV